MADRHARRGLRDEAGVSYLTMAHEHGASLAPLIARLAGR